MAEISGFPYFEVQFTKDGAVHDEDEVRRVLDFVSGQPQGSVTDLIVISHGWNNDMGEARRTYGNLFALVRKQLDGNRPQGLEARNFAVLGILWPSKKFADEELTASGAASFETDTEQAEILQQLETLKGAFDNPDEDAIIERAKALVPLLDTDPNAATRFTDLIRSLPYKGEQHADDGTDKFFKMPAGEIVDVLSRPDVQAPPSGDEGGAANFDSLADTSDQGGAAGFGDIFGGVKAAARNVLNFTTYYQMKVRAGTVGRGGVYQVLRRIRGKSSGMKIHLIGHSFGGRLVTAAANGPDGEPPVKPDSMTLLQAAFSHYGFAENFDGQRDGFFRKVIAEKKVTGPIIVTHSIKDNAVGIAYPIASKLSGDDAAGFGDQNSLYGGIGRNGAQITPEADNSIVLSPPTFAYSFKPGRLYNLKADNVILGHSDIVRPEVAHVILSVIAST
ncbi:MAG TPA: hypothetical protein VK363_04540 [Pyrinomonadaceae bacterium]|nr:hypothetical protein [Pyrinomonadaceae bacterium]